MFKKQVSRKIIWILKKIIIYNYFREHNFFFKEFKYEKINVFIYLLSIKLLLWTMQMLSKYFLYFQLLLGTF